MKYAREKNLLLIILFFFFAYPIISEAKWVTVIGESNLEGKKTAEEAKEEALQQARSEAVAKVVGRVIRAQQLDLRSSSSHHYIDMFNSLSQSTSWGKIIEEKVVLWEVKPIQRGKNKFPILVCRVTLKANVIEEKGKPDPGFKLSVELNDVSFKEGEEMIISLCSTQDAYVTIFNVLANDTVVVLFPNQRMKENFIKAKKRYDVPSKKWRKQGIRFRVGLLPDTNKAEEMILVIATKENISFRAKELKEGSFNILPTHQDALTTINRWLLSIPLDKRTWEFLTYQIIRK